MLEAVLKFFLNIYLKKKKNILSLKILKMSEKSKWQNHSDKLSFFEGILCFIEGNV